MRSTSQFAWSWPPNRPPPLLIIDHDEAGELVVAAEQVDSKAHALSPVGIRILALQQPQRRAEQISVERVDVAEVAAEQVSKLLPAQQLLLQLA